MLVAIEMLHRLCHDMRSRVPQSPAAIGVVKRQKLDFRAVLHGHHEIIHFAVDLRDEHLLRERIAHGLHEIDELCPVSDLADTAILQCYLCHLIFLLKIIVIK